MGWSIVMVGAQALQSTFESYMNVINAITYFNEPTMALIVIANKTILSQYSINQGIEIFGKYG